MYPTINIAFSKFNHPENLIEKGKMGISIFAHTLILKIGCL